MEFVVYDKEGKFLEKIEAKIQECLSSQHAQKMSEQVKDFMNSQPSENVVEEQKN